MKITRVILEVKQGLPNYSARTATVEACVDDSEDSLDIVAAITRIKMEIETAWQPKENQTPKEQVSPQPKAELLKAPKAARAAASKAKKKSEESAIVDDAEREMGVYPGYLSDDSDLDI